MKFTTVLAFIATATVVSAAASTNAERMARGLPPMPPAKRASPAEFARRTKPSSHPKKCKTGSMHCCQSLQRAGHNDALDNLLDINNLKVPAGQLCGMNCSPISAIGLSDGGECTSQTVCCDHVHQHGLVNLGCTPINAEL